MKLITLLLLTSLASAGDLPDAPHLKMRHPIETYEADQRLVVHNSPSQFKAEKPYPILDWQFVAVHSAYAGALASDLYFTSRGVSNGCEEASSNLGPYPSNKKIVSYGLIEFGAVLGGDLAMKALARHMKLPRYMGFIGGSVGAGIGTFKHTRGSLAWTRTNCL